MSLKPLFAISFCLLMMLNLSSVYAIVPAENQQPQTLEKVTLQLKWLHQFQFAGYYAAKMKGYYQQEGLEVEIKQRDLFKNNIQQVIDGEAEYGISDSILLLYLARNEPVSIVAPIFQHSPQVLVTLKSSGIDTPYKLNGKKVIFYQKDTDGFPLLAMFEHLGIKPDLDRTVIKADPASLVRGETQAYPSYLSNEPYQLLQAGHEINIFRPRSFGIDFYGDMLFTSHNEANNHPQRVEAFKRATIKGWHYAMRHKEELARHIQSQYAADKTLDHLLYEANTIEEIMDYKSIPIGSVDQGRLQYIQNLFLKHGLIESRLPIEQGIFKPENQVLNYTEQELAWIKTHPQVKVAVDQAWPPMEFVDEDGEFSGIAAGYLHYLSHKTGIEFIPATELDWSSAVEQAKQRKLDMYSAVINTPERRAYMRFTEPYLSFPMVIATQKGEPFISDIERLNSKVFSVVKDYASHENMQIHYPDIELLLVDTPQQGIEAVSKGLAYGYVDNLAVISHLIKNEHYTSIQISGETPFRADINMAIRNDWPELHSIIQKTLNQLDETTKHQLTDPWLQVAYKTEIEWRTLLVILVPLLTALLLFLIYNRRLKHLNNDLLETQQQLTQSNQQLEKFAETDYLTHCYNRSYIDQVLLKETERTNRYHNPVTLILIDLDNFKQVNDTFGHLIGDDVLILSSHWIKNTIRKSDTFGRWGGEEFVVICPQTELMQAQKLAEKIRQGVAQLKLPEEIQQTLSIGVARYELHESTASWIARADAALYTAKSQGKNQVVCAPRAAEHSDEQLSY